MSTSKDFVLVTGLSSFVGSHIVLGLLNEGYRVRGTVRTLNLVQDQVARNGTKYPNLEVIQVSDIAISDLSSAFEGINAVIHVASPTPNERNLTAKQFYDTAVSGTLNILRNASEQGVKRVVLTSSSSTTTSSFNTIFDWSGVTCSNKSWYPVSPGDDNPKPDSDVSFNYNMSKVLAERAAWKFVNEHPELDVVTIHPPFVYGPYVCDFQDPTQFNIGSNFFLHQLFCHEEGASFPHQVFPGYCDVRDVARAHIAALEIPSSALGTSPVDRRFLICAGNMLYKDVVELLWKERPRIRDRLYDPTAIPALIETLPVIDTSLAQSKLGLTEHSYISWQKTVLDTFDAIEYL